eukprot:COSAG06_NODE_3478_length_5284_cov_56.081774_8_plen_299_part_00
MRFVGTVVIFEMQPDRSMVAQRGASAPTEEGEREGPLGPEPAAPSAVLNDPMQLMQMMQQMVTASMAPMMAKVTEVADRQDAFERRASMPPADVDAGEVSAGRRAQRLDGLHGADNLSANAPGPEQSGDTPVLAYGTGARISPSQEGSPPAHVPSGSAGGDHDGPDGPLSQCLESTGGLAAPADSVASSLAPHGQAATMVLDRPPTRSGAKTKTAAIENTQEEDTMGASGLLRSSSGESLSAPFYATNDHFTKTGSGQTQRKHPKRDDAFCAGEGSRGSGRRSCGGGRCCLSTLGCSG